MTLRARVATLVTLLLVVLGAAFGIGTSAQAAPAAVTTSTSTNGCIVVPSLQLAACLNRF
ncbi:MAG TPA: hypothetical protein VGZ52_12175 [Acidimicrobiales bacterium]|jgi:hypothetical protein|nr:hypothetical protein [Acidimicrobiales bacterium]